MKEPLQGNPDVDAMDKLNARPRVERHDCCICKEEFEGEGNNSVSCRRDGLCCDKCNLKKVIPARIRSLKKLETLTKQQNVE
jgi:hypothetical protein